MKKFGYISICFFCLMHSKLHAQSKIPDYVKEFNKQNPAPKGSYYSISTAEKHPEKVKHLTLVGLKEIPIDVLKFKNLVELDLGEFNNIEQIPSWFQKLKSLQILIIRNNKLRELPEFIFHLPALKELDVWGNSISSFTINQPLTNSKLEDLNLSMNRITEVPVGLVKLTSLKMLMLENNHLTKIPSEVFKMKSLEYVYLYHNDISGFDTPVHIESHLKRINLANNTIHEGQLQKLKELLPNCDIDHRNP